MTVRDVLKLGCIELITKTKQVSFPLNSETVQEIKDMKDTLLSIPNLYGLTANQIGIDKQIIVINESENSDPVVMINPIIDLYLNEKTKKLEEVVSRYNHIHVSSFDDNVILCEKQYHNLNAINVQNKIDYLNGVNIIEASKALNILGKK